MITLFLAMCGCVVAPIDSRDQGAMATQGGTCAMAVVEPCVGPLGWGPVFDVSFFLDPYSCVYCTTSFKSV